MHAYKLHCFRYTALKAATQKFSTKNFLGQGGFGDVHKGYVAYCTMAPAKPGTGFPIAVKRLRKRDSQGHEEWQVPLTNAQTFSLLCDTSIYVCRCRLMAVAAAERNELYEQIKPSTRSETNRLLPRRRA